MADSSSPAARRGRSWSATCPTEEPGLFTPDCERRAGRDPTGDRRIRLDFRWHGRCFSTLMRHLLLLAAIPLAGCGTPAEVAPSHGNCQVVWVSPGSATTVYDVYILDMPIA